MSRHDDPSDEMARFPSPADTELLLGGRTLPDELPDDAARLARLLAAMQPVATDDPFTERRVVSEITAEILRNPASDPMPSLLRSSGSRISAKAGALAFVAVLATGTAAAAATGSLPPSIQRAVSDALSHVSISVPHPEEHDNTIESHDGDPDERRNDGASPGDATEPVTPRGDRDGKDDDTTPRGVTITTPGSTTTSVPDEGNDGPDVLPPTSVPQGPGTTNPNKGKGNDRGQHNGDDNGKGKGKPAATTPTTEKQNSNAGGNADTHAS